MFHHSKHVDLGIQAVSFPRTPSNEIYGHPQASDWSIYDGGETPLRRPTAGHQPPCKRAPETLETKLPGQVNQYDSLKLYEALKDG